MTSKVSSGGDLNGFVLTLTFLSLTCTMSQTESGSVYNIPSVDW